MRTARAILGPLTLASCPQDSHYEHPNGAVSLLYAGMTHFEIAGPAMVQALIVHGMGHLARARSLPR